MIRKETHIFGEIVRICIHRKIWIYENCFNQGKSFNFQDNKILKHAHIDTGILNFKEFLK